MERTSRNRAHTEDRRGDEGRGVASVYCCNESHKVGLGVLCRVRGFMLRFRHTLLDSVYGGYLGPQTRIRVYQAALCDI